MAQRRMFSPEIVQSDAFLEMPPSTQALYFHLSMRADDDGFVNPRVIMRTIGSTDDELKVLIGKRFVLAFDNGVIVIKHWRINNFIRKDRYKETLYLKEKSRLYVRDNQAYTDKRDDNSFPIAERLWKSDEEIRVLSSGQPPVNHRSTQVRLGKVRIGEGRGVVAPSSPRFLKEIPDDIIQEMVEKFNCEEGEVVTKGRKLFDYCEAKNRKYKNYKAFLSNALRTDFGERPAKSKIPIFDTSSGTAKVVGYK